MLVRFAPLALVAVVSFGVGVTIAAGSAELDAAKRFADAWAADDIDAMYAELTPDSQAEYPAGEFESAYRDARKTSTLATLTVGEARGPIDENGEQVVPIQIEATTDSFGSISGEVGIPVSDGGVDWQPSLVFPGLEPGEELARKTKAPERAPILGADKTPLAEGPAAARTTNGAGGIVTGEVGEPDQDRAAELEAAGFPEGTLTGLSGLEQAFDEQLAGTPGGKLLAVSDGTEDRVLAASDPIPGEPLRTTIDPGIQQLASDALGGQFGGVAVLDAKTGDVRALSGVAFSAPQPPGSTMKIITAAAALEEGVTELDEEFPVVSSTNVGGYEISNAHDELCGGNLTTSFAKSCNTVFAPLGAELGADKFVDYTEKFGFNSPPSLYDKEALARTKPPSSTIPDPLKSELDVGVSAIGQGQVLATPLEMASVAQTIANNGIRSPTSLVKDPELAAETGDVEVVSPETADKMRGMMVEVVKSGTGAAGAIPEAQVAGKTGTAELGPKAGAEPDPDTGDVEQEVDAWFSAFAPADKPELVVAVMIVNADGDGGVVAAPIAAQILSGAL